MEQESALTGRDRMVWLISGHARASLIRALARQVRTLQPGAYLVARGSYLAAQSVRERIWFRGCCICSILGVHSVIFGCTGLASGSQGSYWVDRGSYLAAHGSHVASQDRVWLHMDRICFKGVSLTHVILAPGACREARDSPKNARMGKAMVLHTRG